MAATDTANDARTVNQTKTDKPSNPSNPSDSLAVEISSALTKYEVSTGLHVDKVVITSTMVPNVPFVIKIARAVPTVQIESARAYNKRTDRLFGTLLGASAATCNCPECRRERGEDVEDGPSDKPSGPSRVQ